MSIRLKTLEKFLRKKGFLHEAGLCFDLSKIAMPFRKSPEGEIQHFKIRPKDLEGGYGWVYIIKAAPIPGGLAPFSWYVGQSASPEIRYVEHAFTHFSMMPTPLDAHRKKTPYYDPIYAVNSPKFTEEHPPLEIVCMQLFNYKGLFPGLFESDRKGRGMMEMIVFMKLGAFVGSVNIGGDNHLLKTAAKENWQPHKSLLMKPEEEIDAYKERYASTVKSYIKNEMKMSCNSGNAFPDLASDLNELEWDDISDDDKRRVIKRHEHFSGGKKIKRDRAWAAEKLEKLSPEEQNELGSKIRYIMNNDIGVTNHASLVEAVKEEVPFLDELNQGKLDALTRRENLDVHISFLSREEKIIKELDVKTISEARSKTINALTVNFEQIDAAGELGISASKLTDWLKDLNINYKDHLNKEPAYIKMIGRKIWKEEIIQALRCSKTEQEAKLLLGLTLGRGGNERTYDRRKGPVLSPYEAKDYLNTATPEDYERAEREGKSCHKPPLTAEDKPRIIDLLIRLKGNVSQISKHLGLPSPTVRAYLEHIGINPKEYKDSYVKPEDTITFDETESLDN